ncbi:hypothetical protein PR048_008087 [Dryococelus australis]|uniref:Galactose mutarotase n=1 Tax=Dryococelus australis TaxID=614101 RepID=A0ABQ9HWZ5_9NEOP|nr:hypothetical protein PR048_008087 [Dryococelus australis]
MGQAIPLVAGGGYDHTFVLDRWGDGGVQFAARAVHPPTGRTLEVFTDQPCLQFYTGGMLPAVGSPTALVGRSGTTYDTYGGFCFETLAYPDAVNNPHFPDIVLRPSQTYHNTAIYRFGVTKKAS